MLEEGGHLCVSVGGLVSGVRLDPVTNNNGESGYQTAVEATFAVEDVVSLLLSLADDDCFHYHSLETAMMLLDDLHCKGNFFIRMFQDFVFPHVTVLFFRGIIPAMFLGSFKRTTKCLSSIESDIFW